MLALFRTDSSADWKGRPNSSLLLIGQAASANGIIILMDADVFAWQADDMKQDIRIAEENGEELESPVTWEQPNVRWEMKNAPLAKWHDNLKERGQSLRKFAENRDGEFSSIIYHVFDLGDQSAPENQEHGPDTARPA